MLRNDYEMINVIIDYRTIITDFELVEIECLNVVDLGNCSLVLHLKMQEN